MNFKNDLAYCKFRKIYKSKFKDTSSMTNISWWIGMPKEIEMDLELLSETKNN